MLNAFFLFIHPSHQQMVSTESIKLLGSNLEKQRFPPFSCLIKRAAYKNLGYIDQASKTNMEFQGVKNS